jgi:hypothetical protein
MPNEGMNEFFQEDSSLETIPPVTPPVTPTSGETPPPNPPTPVDTPPVDPPVDDPPADENEEGTLWDDVNELRGRDIAFDLPEGIEPDTPEAIIHFESVIRTEERTAVIEELKTNDPKAYAYLLHRQRGGSDDEFFGKSTGTVLPNENELLQSIDLQKGIYKSSLIEKGIDEETANLVVDKAVTDKTIGDKSKAIYDQRKAAESKLAEDLVESTRQASEANDKLGKSLVTDSRKLVTENSLSFRIPEEEKGKFLDFFAENVVVTDGKAYVALELDQQNLTTKQALEQMYLLYRKGDISKVLVNGATNKQVGRFKRKAQAAGVSPSSQQQQQQQQESNNPTVSDFFDN